MKDVVLTDKGPKPIGPYSQAIKSSGFLFASALDVSEEIQDFFFGQLVYQPLRHGGDF